MGYVSCDNGLANELAESARWISEPFTLTRAAVKAIRWSSHLRSESGLSVGRGHNFSQILVTLQ